MRVAILSIFFLMFCGQAIAKSFTLLPDEDPAEISPETSVRWIKYGQASEGETFYYDPTRTSHITKGKIGVWSRHTISAEQRSKKLPMPLGNVDDYSHSLVRYVFNCSSQQMATASRIMYSNNGKTLDSRSLKDSEWEFEDVDPESVSQTLMNLVCTKKNGFSRSHGRQTYL
jgi:hypothetical protein